MMILPIREKWLRMIISCEKREEYREKKSYWTSRFSKIFKDGRAHVVRFRAGYNTSCSYADCLVNLREGCGRAEWGGSPNVSVYILEIKDVGSYYLKEGSHGRV